jgi:hypothetical protein
VPNVRFALIADRRSGSAWLVLMTDKGGMPTFGLQLELPLLVQADAPLPLKGRV